MFRAAYKVNGSLIAVVGQKIRRFFETETIQRTAGIHIPLSRRVLRLLGEFVRHDSSKLRIASNKISSGLITAKFSPVTRLGNPSSGTGVMVEAVMSG
jgi:hypothetical protein